MRTLLLLYLLTTSQILLAQLPKGMYLEGSFHFGKAIKHRSTIKIDFPDFSYGAELNLEFKTYGKKDWHQRCGFPRWGVAAVYHYTGNNSQMGSGIAIVPNITVDFFKSKKIRIFGRLGIGLGVITKPYDAQTNPLNNMVGSYLNNNTSIRLGMAWRVSKNLELRPSATFSHFSNAASTLPNLGINMVTFQMGLCYMYNPVEEEDYIKVAKEDLPKRNKRIQFSHVFSMGFREYLTSGGPKYPVFHTSLDAGLFITRNNRLKAGIEYDYIGAVHAFIKHNGSYGDNLAWQASRINLFIADEILLGRFSISAQVGFYVTQNVLQPWFMVIRLSGRYYLLDPYDNPVAPFITVTMKTHNIVAEYFSMGIGTAF